MYNTGILALIARISAIYYISPINCNYWWNFGFLAFIFLLIQIITGLVLAFFYNPDIIYTYASIMYINNEVYYGWLFRSLHMNGSSFFFAIVYIHIFRNIYYGSFLYPRQLLWISGIIMYALMCSIAFLGYVLPWGQMSFWGAIVMTSLITAIPLIGNDITYLLWGGFFMQSVTLQRFLFLHFMLTFILLFMSIIHIWCLHEIGSNNPLGIPSILDNIPFMPYYILKDLIGLLLILYTYIYIVFESPDLFAHADNYIIANILITPAHIVPEWYFLFFYALLRCVASKLVGTLLILLVFFLLVIMPFLNKYSIIRSNFFKPFSAFFFWGFCSICILLGWIGGLPVQEPYFVYSLKFAIVFFFFLIVIFPYLNKIDNIIYTIYSKII